MPLARSKAGSAWPSLAALILLAGCALQPPAPSVPLTTPARWEAPLPTAAAQPAGSRQLRDWWRQLGDPALVALIDAAQAASPTIATARSRFLQAQATRTSAQAALGPTLDASTQSSRGFSQIAGGVATQHQAGLQTSWEIDLFGANRTTRDAADARLQGAQAQWHDARTSVAAEVANEVNSVRSCRRDLAIQEADAASRAETARLTGLAMRAGFQSSANAALARASSAEASARVTQQRAQCDIGIKTLVALTALEEAQVRARLETPPAAPPPDALFAIDTLPAAILAQRPDVFDADRNVAAASAEVGSAQAKRYPRLTLGGQIGVASFRTRGMETDVTAWTIGPLQVNLPLFDGGRRVADIDAARARYDEAVAQYRATARQAVSEVEQALVNLHGTAARTADAQAAVAGYQASFNAIEQSYRSGLASLLELEESRRTLLAARTTRSALERERLAAWIALYRAAGGGWTQGEPAPAEPRASAS
ncbi:efflux transporter outer membrane subunit [Pigmentiphaga humi]|nr:efflux transporter outer membrane subunit [Pigmentiphaga humi]